MTRRPAPAAVRAVTLAVAAWAALAVVSSTAGPASAASYRYWSYWHGTASGGWSFSPVGAGGFRPAAGSVDGWRFAVSGAAGSVRPRAAASFDAVCGSHAPAPAGQKLVGLVVDYGTTADAPPGQHPPRGVDTFCALVATSGTSAQVLTQYSSVRSESGLVCAIDGYPANECGVVVQPPPSPRPTTHPSTPPPSHSPAPSGSVSHAGGSVSTPAGAASTTTAAPTTASTTAPGTSTSPGSAAAATGSGDPQPVAVGDSGVRPPPESGGAPVGAMVGVLLVAGLGGAAFLRSRRASQGPPGGAP